MLRALRAEVLRRPARLGLLLSGILVASVSFSLLTAAASTSSARVQGTVGQHWRSAYDILVRPKGSYTALERSQGLVQANYLSGIFGGISVRQWHQVQRIPGVAVAAPIAMVGYAQPFLGVPVDLTTHVTGAPRQLFRVQASWTADDGLSRYADPADYVYVTRHPLAGGNSQDEVARDLPHGHAPVCGNYNEVLPPPQSPFAAADRTGLFCWTVGDARDNDLNDQSFGLPRGHYGATIAWSFPFLLAAVDPQQEDKLVHLDHAVVAGRPLTEADHPTTKVFYGTGHHVVPVLAATVPFIDDELHITVQRLALGSHRIATDLLSRRPDQRLATAPGRPLLSRSVPPGVAYHRLLGNTFQFEIDQYWTGSPTPYVRDGRRTVTPQPVRNPVSVWADSQNAGGFATVPLEDNDTGFRRLNEHLGSSSLSGGTLALADVHPVGRIDAAKIPGFDPLTRVPLSTYKSPLLSAADPRTDGLLRGQPLPPDANIAGYLQPPPLLLTNLRSLPALTNPQVYQGADQRAPISVIRVRVGGLHGPVRQKLARIGQIASQIQRVTGLQVDVTAGSSPTAVTVRLPAGRYGRPALDLDEPWVQKGVAVVVLRAIDRKSLALFILVLIVCGLFLGNAASAAVRGRRGEIATLRTFGWSSREVFTLILGELAAVGLAAGLLGAVTALLLSSALGLHLPALHAWLVIPAALGVAIAAGLLPARQAAHVTPMEALRPAVRPPRRTRPIRRLSRLAAANVWRRPAQSVLAASGLTLGVAALTVLLAISFAFRGAVTGNLLGNVIAVQVRSVDYVSAALAITLGAVGVADVIALGQRERAGELATLRASGWSSLQLQRVTLTEGWVLGATGSLLGAMIGLGGAAAIAPHALGAVTGAAAVAATAGIAVVMLALLAPAALTLRVNPAHVLAGEA